jgi:hypothetical protein
MCAKFTDQGILVTVDVAVFFFFLFLQPFFIDSLGNTTKNGRRMVTTMEDNEEKSENGQNFSVPTLLVCSNISKLWLLNKRCSNCPHWKTVVSQHKL